MTGEELRGLLAQADFVDAAMTGSGRVLSSLSIASMKLLTVVGTRPELIRLSLVFRELHRARVENHLVHTGQNYDPLLCDIFFEELELPAPDVYLEFEGRDGRASRSAHIIARSERVLLEERPDALLVLGDTNSGLSAIAAARHNVPIFHMEAGNRCFDWRVPEEKNRKLIDHVSDWLLPYTPRSREYLLARGDPPDDDPALREPDHGRAGGSSARAGRPPTSWNGSSSSRAGYLLATSHREETVDVPAAAGGRLPRAERRRGRARGPSGLERPPPDARAGSRGATIPSGRAFTCTSPSASSTSSGWRQARAA